MTVFGTHQLQATYSGKQILCNTRVGKPDLLSGIVFWYGFKI